MEHFIITISRACGSGGSIVGRSVAEKLGIPYYDRILIDEIARKNGLDKNYIPHWKSTVSDFDIWGADEPLMQMGILNFIKPPSFYYTNEKEMFLVQSRIINELADNGPCVFIGRCADHILKDRKRCLRVWIGADESSRTRRLYDEYWIRTGSLTQKLRIVDEGRAAYYKRCTGQIWGEHYNYHMHLDSGAIGIEACSKIICSGI